MLDRKLYTLIRAAETGSFSKAGAELNLTQPAVSQQISQLETELGVRLFIRKRGSLSLTRQGEIVLRYARNLLKTYNGIWSELDDLRREFRHILVGITPIAQSSPLVDVLLAYSMEQGHCKFSMYERSPDRICSLVQSGVASWGILDVLPESRTIPEGLELLPVDTEPLMCVLPPSHPLTAEASISIDALLQERMIMPQPKYTSTELFAEALQRTGRSPDALHIILETDDVASLKRFTAAGLGITVLPESSCRQEVRSGTLVLRPLRDIHVLSQLGLVYSAGSRDSDILQEIVTRYHRFCQENPAG